ncbi:MAG: hypothetical protein KF893_25515 [Caldilineaceae bacterium]|nr:hypothetical protein [Caldilineaceae bacterium]
MSNELFDLLTEGIFQGVIDVSETEAITGAALDRAAGVMPWNEFLELESAVNLAVGEAAKAGFIAGVKFQRDPAQFILPTDK